MGQKSLSAPDGNHGEPVQGRPRSYCTDFMHFRKMLLELGEVDSVQLDVIVLSDRPLVYLDTSRMGFLYGPLIPEGNISTKFTFFMPNETSSLSTHKKDASATENSVSFCLKSQAVEDATAQVSAEPIGLNEYDLTLQVTDNPSVLVADPSAIDSNLFAVYADITDTQRAYLIPNTNNLQNSRRRTLAAHVDPSADRFVFEVRFQCSVCGDITSRHDQESTQQTQDP